MTAFEDIQNAYPPERDSEGSFVWVRGTFALARQSGSHLILRACYHGHRGELSIQLTDGSKRRIPLRFGWKDHIIELQGTPRVLVCDVTPVPHSKVMRSA